MAADPLGEAIPPAALLLLGAASYLLRPAARRLPSSLALGVPSSTGEPAPATNHG